MVVLPTLSLTGWITDPEHMMEKIYQYFLLSNYNESRGFEEEVASMKYLMTSYGADGRVLVEEVIGALTKLYNRYYDNVTVDARIDEEPGTNGKINYILVIYIEAIKDGKKYILNKNNKIGGLSDIDVAIEYFKSN